MVSQFALPAQALHEKAIHGLLGDVIPYDFSDRIDGNLHARRAPVAAGSPIIPEGLLSDYPAILAVPISPENNDEPFFDDAGNDDVRYTD